jgi:ribosomal protein S18 acetylase RimI-like enzyme
MSCRDAVIGDGPAVAQIWVEAWRGAYAGLMPAEFLAALSAADGLPRFAEAIQSGRSILVAEHDAAVVGFSLFGSSRDDDATAGTGEVIAINLLPSHWRRGLGRMLLDESARRLHSQGFAHATLWVLHGNMRARRFYEALGWRPDGGEKVDDTLTGFPLHEVRYRRELR